MVNQPCSYSFEDGYKLSEAWVRFMLSNILNHVAPSNWTASSSTPTFLIML